MTIQAVIGLIAEYMLQCRFFGCASFWNTIYVLPGNEHNERFIRHERCRLEQIKRNGRILFSIKYRYLLDRHGY